MNLDEVVKSAMSQGAMVERPLDHRVVQLPRVDVPVLFEGEASYGRKLVHVEVDVNLPDGLSGFERVIVDRGRDIEILVRLPDGSTCDLVIPWSRVKAIAWTPPEGA